MVYLNLTDEQREELMRGWAKFSKKKKRKTKEQQKTRQQEGERFNREVSKRKG